MSKALIGKVTGRTITTNKDGPNNKIMLQVEITDPDDIQTIEFMNQAGEDTNPPNDTNVIILSIGEAWKIAIASDDNIEPSMDIGEKKLYSTSDGSIQGFINILNDGIIEINGNNDFAVRFNALKTAFDQLKSDFNSHTHVSVTSLGTPTVPVPQSSADITPAKVNEVKIS